MAKKHKKAKVERYHDRVARAYDNMYDGNRYWDMYREITWRHLKRYLPEERGSTALDAGCGTGLWGLKLARCGLITTFLDISQAMVDVAEEKAQGQGLEKKCHFVKSCIETLDGVEDKSIDLATAQGDPLSCCRYPEQAVRSIHRVLKEKGRAVISVDGLFGATSFFFERSDVAGLEKFIRSGKSNWQTEKKGEQFETKAFSAARLRKLFESNGFKVLSLIGKPVFPLRRFRQLLDDREVYRKLLALEMKHGGEAELLGGAAHLEIAVEKV